MFPYIVLKMDRLKKYGKEYCVTWDTNSLTQSHYGTSHDIRIGTEESIQAFEGLTKLSWFRWDY